MKDFNVYKHRTQGYKAVKCGFSWPAFFFQIIWSLTMRMWGFSAAWIGIYMSISALGLAIGAEKETQMNETGPISLSVLFALTIFFCCYRFHSK